VEEDLKKMKVRNWKEKCKDRRLWNEIVKQAKTHPGLQRRVKKKIKALVLAIENVINNLDMRLHDTCRFLA
jgi:hypothetical protein